MVQSMSFLTGLKAVFHGTWNSCAAPDLSASDSAPSAYNSRPIFLFAENMYDTSALLHFHNLNVNARQSIRPTEIHTTCGPSIIHGQSVVRSRTCLTILFVRGLLSCVFACVCVCVSCVSVYLCVSVCAVFFHLVWTFST